MFSINSMVETDLRDKKLNKTTYTDKLFNIFLFFLFYSFMGWVFETIYMSIYHGHVVKRGFLMEPLCGVYGIGTILVLFILTYIKPHPFFLFLYASLLTTILELIAGILLETLLNRRLWDYSDKAANFMGFICLRNTIIWGLLSIFVVYIVHPILIKVTASIPIKKKEIICCSVFMCLSFDICISIYTSLKGIDNIAWVSQLFYQRLTYIENVTSKVVYYISH